MRKALAFFVVAAALCLSALAETPAPEKATIEFDDRAVVVSADRALLEKISRWAAELEPDAARGRVEDLIRAEFGDGVDVEVFETGRAADAVGVKTIRTTLRAGAMDGLIPPLEGLSAERAKSVLGMFGFTSVTVEEFESLTEQGRIRLLAGARSGRVAVIHGADAFDAVVIHLMREADGEKAGKVVE
ncbi:MAG TPA: hypothetical protein PLK80_14585 [bacterium]|nr:MAG: hypothetical protein BWY28_02109 [bacterium ADurb.Bin236]HPI77957.1 hypothetical protein [bacterium]HPN95267.1 hypothetical protein [bacterium]